MFAAASSSNGSTDATGKINGADLFDGSDDYLTVTSTADLKITGAFTISAWIKNDTLSGTDVVRKGLSGNVNYLMRQTGNYSFYVEGSDAANHEAVGGSPSTGTWYLMAGTFDGTDTLRVFSDGVQIDDEVDAGGYTADTDNNRLDIGQNTAGAGYFDGTIDEVRVSKVDRGVDWLLFSFNNQNAPGTYLTFGSEVERTVPLANLVIIVD